MPRYRLYCFGESGNAYKAALMLELSGCDWEPVFVDFFGGTTRDPAWREGVNEMGEAPVLEDGELRLTQSGLILDHLAKATGRFAPRDEEEARDVWRWILFDNHKFTSYFATLRFLFGIQKTGETPVTEWLRGRAKAAYGVADKHLATRDFLLGERPTIADISLAGYVFYPEETGLDVDGLFPSIARWRERIRALPGWKHPYDLMPRKA